MMSSDSKRFCQWILYPLNSSNRKTHRQLILKHGDTAIGRALSNSLVTQNTQVSQHHCIITLTKEGVVSIKDLRTINGTFVGKERVNVERGKSLKHRDCVGLSMVREKWGNNIKVIRKLLKQEEIATCDPDTIVPALFSTDDPERTITISDSEDQASNATMSTNISDPFTSGYLVGNHQTNNVNKESTITCDPSTSADFFSSHATNNTHRVSTIIRDPFITGYLVTNQQTNNVNKVSTITHDPSTSGYLVTNQQTNNVNNVSTITHVPSTSGDIFKNQQAIKLHKMSTILRDPFVTGYVPSNQQPNIKQETITSAVIKKENSSR